MTFKTLHIKFSPRFGNFPAIISLNKLSAFFSLSSPSGSPIILKLTLLMIPNRSLVPYSFLSFLPVILQLDYFNFPVFDLTDSFFCLIYSVVNYLYWTFNFNTCNFEFLWHLHNFYPVLFIMMSISLLNFSFCSYTIFSILLNSLYFCVFHWIFLK